MASQPVPTASERSLRPIVYTLFALAAATGATAFFASAGPVDPLRDVFFSLAIALDLSSVFLTWQAMRGVSLPWLETLTPYRLRRIRNPEAGITLITWAPVPAPVHVIWGNALWRYVLLVLAVVSYGTGLGLFLRGAALPYVYVAWLAGVVTLLLAYAPRPRVPHIPWRELLAVLPVLAVAFALRAYHLTLIPLRVHGDMASVGLQARRILAGDFPGWFSLGWATIPMWGFAPEALTMRLLGDSLLGLRASAVLMGMLSLLGVYFLGREAWSPRVGWLALAALSVNVVHLHFSRIPSYINPVPWVVWGLFFFVRGYRRRSALAWALAGVCTALAMNMYFSGRLILPILALAFLYLALFFPRGWRANREGILAFALGFLFTLGPMLIVIARDFPEYMSRARFVSLLDPGVYRHLLSKYQATSLREVVLEQLQRSFLTFQYYGDTSTQFGYPRPMLSPWLAPFFLVGMGVATGRLRHLGNMIVTLWVVLGLILGSVLTVDAPFWPRLVVITPAVALAIALGLTWVWDVVSHDQTGTRTLLGVLVVGLLAWAGWQNWHTYAPLARAYAGENDFAARFMLNVTDRPACYLEGAHRLSEREFAFLLRDRTVLPIRPERWEEDLRQCAAAHGVVVALARDRTRVDAIRARYPGGQLEEIRGPAGTPTLVVYWLP